MLNIACFDLETSNLNANFGILLCAVIKPQGEDPKIFRADKYVPEWKTKRSCDRPLVKAVADELMTYDILIAHNGARFDLPWIRTRMAHWKLGGFPPKKLIDPYQIARNNFRMSSNSLASLGDFFIKNKKTPVSGELWMKASLDGDISAMDYIVAHCIADTEMLEDLVDFVKDYAPIIHPRGSH